MGTLKYAILGLLNRKNMTGYDLSKEFETTLFEFWNAKHSQIYPELKSLSENGLVRYEVEITGNVLEKKVYSITEKGREDFYKWEESLNPLKPVPKDEFRLQLFGGRRAFGGEAGFGNLAFARGRGQAEQPGSNECGTGQHKQYN